MTTVPYTFGDESSPVPLSQLDANFAVTPSYANTAGNVVNGTQANITSVGTLTSLSVSGTVTTANIITNGAITSAGQISAANVLTGGLVSAYGTVTGGAFVTGGTATATGTVTGGNLLTSGRVSAGGNVTGSNILTNGQVSAQGNVLAQGIISATGDIVTAANFVGNFVGNTTGNLSVGGSNTQVLFNLNGNVGAAGGLTYNKDSNVLTVLGTVSAQGNINAGVNLSIGGNLTVGGTGQFTGLITAPTAAIGTANNQVATTSFVSGTVGTLGTMARQNAISVAINGGSIGNAIITLASISNSSINNGTINNVAITDSTLDQVTMVGGWTINTSGSVLYFSYNGNSVAQLDGSGNFTTIGDITAFGSV
jgi:hypothetical protein